MALTFYYGAGSPYTWRVWLALEHKSIPHERRVLSFAEGDLKKPEFLAINPGEIRGEYLAGPVSAADYTLYPMVAIALRCEKKQPDLGLRAALPERINAWMQGVEMLPFFPRTWPAHWK